MRSLFFAFLLFYSMSLVAQIDSLASTFQIELNEHVGKLIKIHGEYPENKISSLTEINFSWKTQGAQTWHNAYNYPSYGFSLVHAQFGNNQVLGQSIAGIPTMRYEKWKGKTRLALRAGFGLAWFNKPYDANDNPRNLVIGSTFTNMTMARLEMSRPLTKNMRYSVGLSFTHCSNSHIAVPNIGANIVALNVGLSFCQSPNALLPKSNITKSKCHRTKWNYSIHGILGMQELIGTVRPIDGPKYPVYGMGVYATNNYFKRGHISFGINYHYYPSYQDYIVSQELFPSGTNARQKAQNVVAFVGGEWVFNRFSVFVQAGINLYNPFMQKINDVWDLPKQGFLNRWTSNKLGYRYYFKSIDSCVQPFVHVAVKANGGTADFLETAIGIRIR
jgi:hypothetical protein